MSQKHWAVRSMMPGRKASLLALGAGLFLCGTTLCMAAQQSVSVRNGRLLLDGNPWTPHGVVQIAFVAPPSAQKSVFLDAYQHYSPLDYKQMRMRGIDSVRIQVSQPGLDPQSEIFDTTFRDRVIGAVHAARAEGLVVLVSVQDEEQSGEQHGVAHLPNTATGRVWASLAPEFAHDPGVLCELLNEPNLPPNSTNWHLWADAMDATIQVVRRAGARNVVVADGLLFAERLDGAANLRDPLKQIAYASHPYAHHAQDQYPAVWDNKFGNFAADHAVIVTEWATVPNFYCDLRTPAATETFLGYLNQHHVGLMAYAWDFSGPKFGSMFHGFPPRLTAFEGLQCGDPGFGPGKAIERWYTQSEGALESR